MRSVFYLILICSSTAFCQIDMSPPVYQEPDNVREYFQYLTTAFNGEPRILVPFMEDGKFGYLNHETLEVVVPPLAAILVLKNSTNHEGFVGELDDYYFRFTDGGNLIMGEKNLGPPQVSEEGPPQNWVLPTDSGIKMTPKTKNSKGFTYRKREDGKISVSSFSEIYDSGNKYDPNLWPIEIDGEVYGIAEIRDPKNRQKSSGIIFPDGNPLKGFDFNFNKILPIKDLKESLGNWFLVQKSNSDDSKFHLINSKGEFLSEKILPKLDYSRFFSKTQISTPYHIPRGVLNYAIYDNKIIDLYELKLLKVIPKKYEIIDLDFIFLENLEMESMENKRQNAKMFAEVKDEKGNWFYMDFNGKKYIPKK